MSIFKGAKVTHRVLSWEGEKVKVVINACHGGFGLSEAAVLRYFEIKGQPVWVKKDKKWGGLGITHYWLVPPENRVKDLEKEFYTMSMDEKKEYNRLWSEQNFYDRDVARDDPILVQVVEELALDADGRYACLKVVEIPDDVDWEINEYDGNEWIAEKHRTWS